MKKILAVLAVTGVGVGALAVPTLASADSSCWYSARGCVSVGGYYKPSTGTYVSPYYRNYPSYSPSYSYRTPSYRTPSYRTPSYGSGYSYRPSTGSSYGSW